MTESCELATKGAFLWSNPNPDYKSENGFFGSFGEIRNWISNPSNPAKERIRDIWSKARFSGFEIQSFLWKRFRNAAHVNSGPAGKTMLPKQEMARCLPINPSNHKESKMLSVWHLQFFMLSCCHGYKSLYRFCVPFKTTSPKNPWERIPFQIRWKERTLSFFFLFAKSDYTFFNSGPWFPGKVSKSQQLSDSSAEEGTSWNSEACQSEDNLAMVTKQFIANFLQQCMLGLPSQVMAAVVIKYIALLKGSAAFEAASKGGALSLEDTCKKASMLNTCWKWWIQAGCLSLPLHPLLNLKKSPVLWLDAYRWVVQSIIIFTLWNMHIPTAFTNHIPTAYQPPTTYRQHTDHILTRSNCSILPMGFTSSFMWCRQLPSQIWPTQVFYMGVTKAWWRRPGLGEVWEGTLFCCPAPVCTSDVYVMGPWVTLIQWLSSLGWWTGIHSKVPNQ